MTLTDDVDSIKRFKHGDLSAFEEIVRRHQDRICNLCRYMLQDAHEAQDAAQDAFLKAYRSLRDFKPDSSLYTWLYRIALNTCLDYQKKSRPEQAEDESVIDDLASKEPSPEQRYQSKEIGQAIQAALQKLPERLRAAIVLKEIEELSYEEIAAKSAETVASTAVRLPVSISAGLITTALGLSLFAGALASYFMGRRTSRMKPVDILRKL